MSTEELRHRVLSVLRENGWPMRLKNIAICLVKDKTLVLEALNDLLIKKQVLKTGNGAWWITGERYDKIDDGLEDRSTRGASFQARPPRAPRPEDANKKFDFSVKFEQPKTYTDDDKVSVGRGAGIEALKSAACPPSTFETELYETLLKSDRPMRASVLVDMFGTSTKAVNQRLYPLEMCRMARRVQYNDHLAWVGIAQPNAKAEPRGESKGESRAEIKADSASKTSDQLSDEERVLSAIKAWQTESSSVDISSDLNMEPRAVLDITGRLMNDGKIDLDINDVRMLMLELRVGNLERKQRKETKNM
jgi:hypothetical protein